MSRSRWTRGLLVVTSCALGEYLVCRLAVALVRPAGEVVLNTGPAGPQATAELATAAAAVLLAAAWGWLTCAATLMVVDVLRGEAPGRRLAAPRAWQRLVAAVLGTGALYLPVAAAAASDNDANGGRSRPAATVVDGLPLPDRPHGTVDREPTTTGYRVTEGDSLWTLARQSLGPGASDARVARAWPLWYAANQDVIGADPDLLIPGTVLKPPAAGPAGPGCSVPRTTLAGDNPTPPHGGRP